MVNKKVIISFKDGLHLRPAKDIAETASKYNSDVFLTLGDLTINCKSILGIVELAANYNSEVIITAEGEDEAEAVEEVSFVIESGKID